MIPYLALPLSVAGFFLFQKDFSTKTGAASSLLMNGNGKILFINLSSFL
jgi:hypothetical protein